MSLGTYKDIQKIVTEGIHILNWILRGFQRNALSLKHMGGSITERIIFLLIAVLFSYFVDFFQCLHQHGDISLGKHTVGIQQIPKRIFISKETSGGKKTLGTSEKKSLCCQ